MSKTIYKVNQGYSTYCKEFNSFENALNFAKSIRGFEPVEVVEIRKEIVGIYTKIYKVLDK